MNKNLKYLGLLSLAFMFILACEPDEDPDDPAGLRDEYLGKWNVQETYGWNAPQSYTVNISEGAEADQIIINGLYNQPQAAVKAAVDGLNINIPQQTTAEIDFWGSGQANADFDQISLNFYANDGAGLDSVKAVLTR